MSALTSDFTNQTVLLYDANGNHLLSTSIREYDKGVKQIIVETLPEALKFNDSCKLIILSSPTPCEFGGRIKRAGNDLCIAMFQGQERENREAARYPVSTPALIPTLVVDGEHHPVQTPIKVVLRNISTTGVRFRAPFYSFDIGDEFQMDLFIGNSQKKITARVVNNVDKEPDFSDYGCRFLLIQ